jgi:uncharacterized iron-regulated protein
MKRRLRVLGLLLVPASCASTPRFESGLGGTAKWSAPPLPRSVSVRDGRTGEHISVGAFLDAIAKADVVFLGEQHTDETTHRVELAVYEGLLSRRKGKVVLALEMFERDTQPDLDEYLAGEIDEATFLERARPWSNYRTSYRPLIEKARVTGGPVVGSNFPAPLRRRVAMEGPSVLESLDDDAKHQAPTKFLPNSPAYWRRVDNAVRGHRAMMGGSGGDDERLYATQSLWDNAMGEACSDALDEHPGYIVLHVNGGFHSAYWDGTVRQLLLRKPDAEVVTVDITPVANPSVAEVEGAAIADYVVFAESRATDINEGKWSVYVPRAQEYRFHLPKDASEDHPVPLLIWLPDDGLTASDGMDLWKDRLGDEVAIAVLETPYPGIQDDMSKGGRWFWPDTFSSDVGATITAIERAWGYILRHYPIDQTRVCTAGEGTGGTVAAAAGLWSDDIDMVASALHPRQYAKIKDFPLPLPEFRGDDPPPVRSLRVIVSDDDSNWWKEELGEYVDIGLNASMVAGSNDPWGAELSTENTLRTALGAEIRPSTKAESSYYFLIDGDSARARHWGRLRALAATAELGEPVAVLEAPPADDKALLVSSEIRAETFAAPGLLPRCPGPFGGTTVIVVPDGASSQDVRAWLALQEDDPLNKESRFHRLRVATIQQGTTLPEVLAALHSENRNNALIVPARFCADAASMRALERQSRDAEDQMTLHWLPGLGGRKIPVSSDAAAMPRRPIHHSLAVVLAPAEHRVTVEDTIELPRDLTHAGVEFTLNAALTIRGSEPPLTKMATDENDNTTYALDAVPADGVLRVTYDGSVDFGLSDEKQQYTRGFRSSRGLLRSDGVYLHGESEWVPRFDDRLIRFELEVQAPADWHVISQGNGTSRDADGRARWESGGSVEQVYLVGGPLLVESDSAGAVEVLVYLHEQDTALSRKYLDATARYIEMYRNLIGPYPYSKFALVENIWETGYGMPSFTLLGPR